MTFFFLILFIFEQTFSTRISNHHHHQTSNTHIPKRKLDIFSYMDKTFLNNEKRFLKSYKEHRGRELIGTDKPLLVSNIKENESPANIQESIKSILKSQNITGSVIIITNVEPRAVEISNSKFEMDDVPFHHPYYYNPQIGNTTNPDQPFINKQLSSSNSPYANLVFPEQPITFRDISTIMVIANSISTLYNGFEELFPTNTTSLVNQTAFQKIQTALIMYAKVRVLVMTFLNKRDQLAQQISFLGSHLLGLQTTETDMIMFNGLQSKYFYLQTVWVKYRSDSRAEKIRKAWSTISTEAINFGHNVQQIIAATAQLIKLAMTFDELLSSLNFSAQSNARKLGLVDSFLNSTFVKEIADSDIVKKIEESSEFKKIMDMTGLGNTITSGNKVLQMAQNFDRFLTGLLKLLQTKTQMNGNLAQLKIALASFQVRRENLVLQLNTIQSEVTRLENMDLLRGYSSRVWVSGILVLMFAFVFK